MNVRQTIPIKCQALFLFSQKTEQNILECHLLQFWMVL